MTLFLKKMKIGAILKNSQITNEEKQYPLPPEELRWRVVANRNEIDFIESGVQSIQILNGFFHEKTGKYFSDCESIFDFGCGCGRLIRHMPQITGAKLHGCDIDSEAIEWCSRNIVDAQFIVGGEYPPLPVEWQKFDLIYAISVFTHIDEEHQFKWLDELKRVTCPNGYLMLTFRDTAIVEGFKDGGIKNKILDDLAKKGISFVHNKGWKGVFPDWYGGTYHTFDYIQETWGRFFHIIDISPQRGAVSQCITLLQNR